MTREGVAAALPDAALAATFAVTWVAPRAFGDRMVRHLLLVMLLEFIVIHSAGFMGAAAYGGRTRVRRGLAILGLGAFYTVFAAAFGFAFGTAWPVIAFWGLTINRLLAAVLHPGDSASAAAVSARGWAVGVVAYVGAALATSVLPVPALGVTPAVRAAQGFGQATGLWVDEPQRVLAAGVLYFGAVAASTAIEHRWLPRVRSPGGSAAAR